MPSGPGWWFNVVKMAEKFTETVTQTKHGEHTRYFIEGKGRVTESDYISQYKGDLFQNQVRGFARANGITNWNEAQSVFSEKRNKYLNALKEATDRKRKESGIPDAEVDRQQREELWEQHAYD